MALEFKLPDLGEGIKSADIVKVSVAPGDVVADGQTVLEVETDKAGLDVPADFNGKVTDILVTAGEKAKPGQVILTYEALDGAAATPVAKATEAVAETPAEPAPAPAEQPAEQDDEHLPSRRVGAFASPSVRRFAREIGVEIDEVPGSGPAGRISVEDVKKFAREAPPAAAVGSWPVPAAALPDLGRYGPVEVEPFSNVRRATAAHMANCWATVPHVTIFDDLDVTDLEALRQQLKASVEQAGGKLTLTVLLVKLLGSALKAQPALNAAIDMVSQQVVKRQYIHLGVAVDTPRGLVVPVLKDVAGKSLTELALELVEKSDQARRGKLAPAEMQGGCLTITNLGSLGVRHFTPIVNHPEVAILGVGLAQQHAVVRGGSIVPRLMLPLSLSFDHRLVDGADGARFLAWLHKAVEQPLLLALEG